MTPKPMRKKQVKGYAIVWKHSGDFSRSEGKSIIFRLQRRAKIALENSQYPEDFKIVPVEIIYKV